MLAIYGFAALPFFTGGSVMSVAFARLTDRINVLYAADLDRRRPPAASFSFHCSTGSGAPASS